MKPICIDFSKAKLYGDTICFPTGTGFDIKMRLSPVVSVQNEMNDRHEPDFNAN